MIDERQVPYDKHRESAGALIRKGFYMGVGMLLIAPVAFIILALLLIIFRIA